MVKFLIGALTASVLIGAVPAWGQQPVSAERTVAEVTERVIKQQVQLTQRVANLDALLAKLMATPTPSPFVLQLIERLTKQRQQFADRLQQADVVLALLQGDVIFAANMDLVLSVLYGR
jgi:hypothetical protein